MNTSKNIARISLPFYVIRSSTKKVYYGENHFSYYYLESPRFLVFIYKRNLGFTVNPLLGYTPFNPILEPSVYIQKLKTSLDIIKYPDDAVFNLPVRNLLKYIFGYLIGVGKDKPAMKANPHNIEVRNASYYARRVLGLEPDTSFYIRSNVWLNLDISIDAKEEHIEAWIKENGENKRRYKILELILEENGQARREIEELL